MKASFEPWREAALAAAAFVDEPAEVPEEVRGALDLVEDDQLVGVLCEIEFRFSEFRAVAFGLQIEVEGGSRFGGLEGQCGFAGLARTEQRDGRDFGEGGAEVRKEATEDCACNRGVVLHDCTGNLDLTPGRRGAGGK